MTSVKATLSVILKANEVVVAEAEDSLLWQRVLAAINAGRSELPDNTISTVRRNEPVAVKVPQGKGFLQSNSGADPLDLLSQQLGVARALVEGACFPTVEPPYLRLSFHCWEKMKTDVSMRGPLAVAAIAASATLLSLWFHAASLGNPTQVQAQAVLLTINLRDKNASRSIRNATWLQPRQGGQVALNPAEISKAVNFGKCFCTKDWTTWKETAS